MVFKSRVTEEKERLELAGIIPTVVETTSLHPPGVVLARMAEARRAETTGSTGYATSIMRGERLLASGDNFSRTIYGRPDDTSTFSNVSATLLKRIKELKD